MTPPKYYIQTFEEKVEGMQYDQPIERMNGKTYWEFSTDSFERQIGRASCRERVSRSV